MTCWSFGGELGGGALVGQVNLPQLALTHADGHAQEGFQLKGGGSRHCAGGGWGPAGGWVWLPRMSAPISPRAPGAGRARPADGFRVMPMGMNCSSSLLSLSVPTALGLAAGERGDALEQGFQRGFTHQLQAGAVQGGQNAQMASRVKGVHWIDLKSILSLFGLGDRCRGKRRRGITLGSRGTMERERRMCIGLWRG